MIKIGFQLVYHTIYTSSRCCIKTHHITTPNITLHRLNSFNHYPFLTYIYITYIILTEIIIIFNCYGVTATLLTTFVPSYCCDNNVTLKMAGIVAVTCS
jgi:hypothetical protein